MSTAMARKIALLVVVLGLSVTSVFARDMRHEHRGNWEHRQRMERRTEHRDWQRAREREHWRHEREHRIAEHRRDWHRPNGWDHGRKTGWGDHSVPPGQAKKYGSNMQFHGPAHNDHHGWNGNHAVPTNVAASSPNGSHDGRTARVVPISRRR